MRFTLFTCVAALSGAAYAANADDTSLTLSPQAIQKGSQNDGQQETGAEAGQAPSLTSQNNFINSCVGQTLTNGLQITTGSCNGIRKLMTSYLIC